MMNIITVLLTAVLSIGCPLIPRPQSSEEVGESYRLRNDVTISYDVRAEGPARLLQGELLRYLGVTSILSQSDDKEKNTVGIILRMASKGFAPEQYSLSMDSDSVVITAGDKGGHVNGVMSFIQLARLSESKAGDIVMDCWKIDDRPRYKWRGFMLDEARHFFGKEKVKQIMDWMALPTTS